jgi:hypothetical protein
VVKVTKYRPGLDPETLATVAPLEILAVNAGNAGSVVQGGFKGLVSKFNTAIGPVLGTEALITPLLILIVVPSTLTPPSVPLVPTPAVGKV